MDADVQRVLALEQALVKEEVNVPVVMLRFPDPELGIDLVKSYSPDIDTVHFVHSFAPRSCFLYLKPNTNVQATIENLSKIPFGNGFLTAEYKPPLETNPAEDVDPYTLYVGNLPKGMPTKKLKQLFPGAKRVDVGFAQRMRNTRFAFVTYATVEAAIESYQKLVNSEMDSRTLIVRFKRKRHKDPAEDKSSNPEPLSTSNTVAHLSVKRQKLQSDDNSGDIVPLLPLIGGTRIKEEIVEESPTIETPLEIAQTQAEDADFQPVPIKTEREETDYFSLTSERNPVVPLLLLSGQNNSSTVSSGRNHEANKKSEQNDQTFLQKLHEDVRRAKFTEDTPKVRDELDDLFAKMNSDDEDDAGF